ncbi:hypothetical protein MMC11_000116 [Xylographa trunciseda]|nr:hypothetical protein [Xylographa trunciseda]
MEKEKRKPYKASGLNFSAAPANRANLTNTTRTENSSPNIIIVKDATTPILNATAPIMDTTTRGRQMTGGRPQVTTAVPRREKKIVSTLLFAHETIGTKETIGRKQYSEKAKKPLGGPAYVENRNRSVSLGPRDLENFDDDDMAEVSDDGNGAAALDLKHQIALESVHNLKVEGGRGPQARKISATLNSDDEIIVRMKTEKRTDREIAQTLQDAGRANYNYKTIGSRWKRLRIAIAKAKDQELNQQIAVWRIEEDEGLLRAIEASDRIVYRMKQEADDQKWEIVTGKLKDLVPTAIYSQKACRERFESLENGTAVIPVEVDDEPMQRIQRLAETRVLYESKLAEEERLAKEGKILSKEAKRIKRATAEATKRAAEAQRLSEMYEPRKGRDNDISAIVEGDFETSEQLEEIELPHPPSSRSSSAARVQDPKVLLSDVPAPRQINGLSFRAQVAAEAERPDAFFAGLHLKDPDLMTRNELRYELRARGLCRDQVKDELVKIVKAARAGETNLKPSPIRGNLNPISLGRNPIVSRPDLVANVRKANQDRYIRASSPQNDEPASKKAKTSVASNMNQADIQGFSSTLDTASKPGDTVIWFFDPANREKSYLSFARSFPTVLNQVVSGSGTNQGQHLKYHEPVTSGRRVFLWDFPLEANVNTVRNLLEPDSIEDISMLGGNHTFIVDMVDRAAAKAAVKAIDGLCLAGKTVVAETALSVARVHQKTLSSDNNTYRTSATCGSSGTQVALSPAVLSMEPVTQTNETNFVHVSNVSNAVNGRDLGRILGNTISCVNVEPGVFLVEFQDAAATEMALLGSNGFRIYGQPIQVQRVQPDPPEAYRPARRSNSNWL